MIANVMYNIHIRLHFRIDLPSVLLWLRLKLACVFWIQKLVARVNISHTCCMTKKIILTFKNWMCIIKTNCVYVLCFVRIKDGSSRHSGIHSMNHVHGLTTQPCQHAVFNHLVIFSTFTEFWLFACLVLDAGSSVQHGVVSKPKSTCLTIYKADGCCFPYKDI